LWDNELLPDKKLDFIIRHRITTLFGPPSDFMPLVIHLEKRKEQFPECIKNIYLGSAPIYGSFLQRLIPRAGQTRITCLYGMTENLMVTYQDGREKAVFTGTGDPVGKAFPGVIISIAKDHEIQIDSKQMFARYWMQIPQTGSHSTGDLGDFDGNGNLVLIGRKKEMIIRRNFNIYPGLYEPTINKIEGVIEAVMIGIYNQTREDEDVILVVEARKEMTADGILKRLKSGEFSIDREAWPDKVIFMKLPRWGRQQKVNRKLLQQLLIKKNG
ncbi:MAG: acyl--CoA ligase, partial [Bacteroidales bacterium]|nr:acyl--CoA ligase [Bacteroidales bacterium]